MENPMEWDAIHGLMDNIMMGSGLTDSNMDLECGEVKKEILIKDNGNLENLRVMEFIHGLMETHIKVNSRNVWNMEKELRDFQMVICIRVDTLTVNPQDMGNITGWMGVILKGIL